VDLVDLLEENIYDSFHCKRYIPEIQQIDKLRFLYVSRNTVLCSTNSNVIFGLIGICTEKFQFVGLVDCGNVAISVESIIQGGEDPSDA